MTPARSFLCVLVAAVVLVCARPKAGDGQFPRGLMSSAPQAVGSCTIETRPLSFGSYDPLAGTEVDAIAQIIYVCSNGNGNGPGTRAQSKGIRIEMDQGGNHSFDPRAMIGPDLVSSLEYNIYLDATHRTIWGTGVGSTQTYIDEHPPNRTPVVVPAFGRIMARQDVPAGTYVDSVRVGIIF